MNGLTLLAYCLIAHQQPSQVGPDNGSLLLVGGGVTPVAGNSLPWLEVLRFQWW